MALGTCIGKFTHTGKFRLTIGCLDTLAQYAKYKVRGRAALRAVHGARGRGHGARAAPQSKCWFS